MGAGGGREAEGARGSHHGRAKPAAARTCGFAQGRRAPAQPQGARAPAGVQAPGHSQTPSRVSTRGGLSLRTVRAPALRTSRRSHNGEEAPPARSWRWGAGENDPRGHTEPACPTASGRAWHGAAPTGWGVSGSTVTGPLGAVAGTRTPRPAGGEDATHRPLMK